MKFVQIGGIYVNLDRVNRVYTENVNSGPQPFHIIIRHAEGDAFRMCYDTAEMRDAQFKKYKDILEVKD